MVLGKWWWTLPGVKQARCDFLDCCEVLSVMQKVEVPYLRSGTV